MVSCFARIAVGAALVVGAGTAWASGEAVVEGNTLTFNVDVADYPESAPYDYEQALPDGITAIVKRGTGSVTLGVRTNTAYTGTVTVEANGGYLMGPVSAFGAPPEIVVNAGGAVAFTETAPIGGLSSTHFKIAGAGPDGKGALLRPCVAIGACVDFFGTMTLMDDATVNVGSRWGFTNGRLNMGNHTLTLRNDRHAAAGWDEQYVCLDIRETLTVKDPGAIVLDGCSLNIEGSSARLADAAGSNGTVSNLTITARSALVRVFATSKDAVPCPLVTEGSASLMSYMASPENDLRKYSNWDGPVTVGTNGLDLTLYVDDDDFNRAGFVFNREVSGPGKVTHDVRGHVFFTGSSTNTLGGYSQGAGGTTYVVDDVHLNVHKDETNSLVEVSGGTATQPATLVLSNRASIVELPTPSTRTKRAGYRIGTKYNYGLLKIYDQAVVSNDVSLGLWGRGACYQFGGYFRQMHGADGNNVIYIGHNGGNTSYGYLGINDGVYEQDHWFYLGSYTPGFMIQRGGRAYQGKNSSGAPMRISNNGSTAYGYYAVLGGKASWRNYAALNFANYTPVSENSTATFTVDGPTAEVDMSSSYIRSVPATNANKAVTALINVGHGGTLKVKYISVEQIYNGANTPAWDTIKELTPTATKTYLNFNGGTLVTAQKGEFFCNSSGVGDDPYRLPTRTTVYEEGLTIDTNGKNVTWRAPLLRPYGYGIKSITLPAAACATHALIGPTRCKIVSAQGGAGADALMDFDDTNRVARGMLITSPGFGYEANPTITVQKANANATDTWTCTAETVDYEAADFAHGGLVKRGEGTLTLTASNSYGGVTRVEGGTLVFTHANGLPSGGALEFAADRLTTGVRELPLLQAAAYNGGAIRITGADTLDARTFGQLRTMAHFVEPLAAVPELTLVRSDGTVMTGSSGYLMLSEDRRSLKFGFKRGPVIIYRGLDAGGPRTLKTSPDYFAVADLPILIPQDGTAEAVSEDERAVILCTKTNGVSSFGVRFDRASRIIGSLAPKLPPHESGTLVLRLTTHSPGLTGVRLEVADTRSNVVRIDTSVPELSLVGTHTVRVEIPHRFPADSKGNENGAFALIGVRFLGADAAVGSSVTIDRLEFVYRAASMAEAVAMELDVGAEPRVLTPATAARGATVSLRNRSNRAGTFDLALKLTDYRGVAAGWSQAVTATLAPDEAWSCTVPCPSRYGVYTVTADVRVHGDPAAQPASRSRAFGYLDFTGATPDVKFPEGLPMGTVGHVDAYFGNEAETVKMADAMAQVGLKILRIDFSPSESSRTAFDRVVEIFSARGINFDFILPQPLTGGRVDLVGHRERWRTAFARYRGRVRYWELINEPDISWSGNMIITPEEYHALAVQTKADLREADPDAQLMSSGFCTFTNEVRGAFQKDAMALCSDVFDLHCFHGHGAYSNFRTTIGKLLTLREELGLTIPWYANETAITMSNGTGERTQAETLYKKLLFSWSRGARGYTWYNLRSKGMNEAVEGEHGYGMLTMQMDPRAVYGAWNNVTRIYGRKGFREEIDLGPAYSCFVTTNAAETSVGLWREQPGASAVRLRTSADHLTRVDLFGNGRELTLDGGETVLAVANEPVNLVLPGNVALAVEPVTATPGDFWDEATFDLRQGGEDLDGDGIAQGQEANDALFAGDPAQVAGAGKAYGDPAGATYRTETVVDPATGRTGPASVLHFDQRLTWTNAAQTAGIARPNTVRWTSLLTTGKPGYSFFLRVRADAVAPLMGSSWIVNFGNEASGGALCGFEGRDPATRTLAFWTMRQSVKPDISLATDRWTDIAVSMSGDTLSWAVLQEGGTCQTGSYTKAGFVYSPGAACTLGSEYYAPNAVAYDAAATATSLKCFRGSISRFVVWERALSADELQAAVTAGETDIFRLGAVNGHGFEFGEQAASAAAVVPSDGRWREFPRDLATGAAVRLMCAVTPAAATVAQTLQVFVTSDSAAGSLAVSVNGRACGTLSVAPGGQGALVVPSGTLVAGSGNVFTMTRTSGDGVMRFDAVRLVKGDE